jgi:hypothetical protein
MGRGLPQVLPFAPILHNASHDFERALELAQTLVRMDTVSRHSNLELIHFVRDELLRLGVRSRLTYSADRRKANLFATLGEGKPAGVILSGHTDTVPGTARPGASSRCRPRCATTACTARRGRHEELHRHRAGAGAALSRQPGAVCHPPGAELRRRWAAWA